MTRPILSPVIHIALNCGRRPTAAAARGSEQIVPVFPPAACQSKIYKLGRAAQTSNRSCLNKNRPHSSKLVRVNQIRRDRRDVPHARNGFVSICAQVITEAAYRKNFVADTNAFVDDCLVCRHSRCESPNTVVISMRAVRGQGQVDQFNGVRPPWQNPCTVVAPVLHDWF